MGHTFENRKHLIADYQKEISRVFYISIALVVLLALPEYGRKDLFTASMQVFSEWMAGWFPQLDVIASARDNPTKTRIVLSLVLAAIPIQIGYFLWTMPVKIRQEDLSIDQLSRKFLVAITGIVGSVISILAALFVLTAPGWENPGHIAQLFIPILRFDIGSGIILAVCSFVASIYVSATSVFFASLGYRLIKGARQ